MSYTPCDLCGQPLKGYAGSACTNHGCANAARPDDRNPYGKTVDGTPYRFTGPRAPEARGNRSRRRGFKGIR